MGGGGGGSGGSGSGLGGLIGTGLGIAGANQGIQAYRDAQQRAEAAGNFTPYNVFSGLGSTTSGPGGVTSNLSPQYQGLRNQYLGNAAAGAGAAGSFDPYQAANTFYGQMQGQAAPYEAQQRADAVAQLQGMGTLGLGVGADTGAGPANPMYAALLKAQADAARQRQISSYGMSQDIANQMQQRALGWGQAGLGLDQSQLQQQQLGMYGGGLQSNAALRGAQLAQQPLIYGGLTRGGLLSNIGSGMMGSGGYGNLGNVFGNIFGSGSAPNSGSGSYSVLGSAGGSNFDPSIDWSNLYG
jgi:hypothetical protein